MAVARRFNGSSDDIFMSSGAVVTTGAWTQLAVVKYVTVSAEQCALMFADSGAGQVFGLGLSATAKVEVIYPGTNSVGLTSLTTGRWYVIAASRPAGAAQTVRVHAYDISTSTWFHENATTAQSNSAQADLNIRFGQYTGIVWMNGEIQAGAFWPSNLSDATIENAGTSWQNLLANGPQAAWLLNQSSIAASVTDGTSGGANQTSRDGTTVASDGIWDAVGLDDTPIYVFGEGSC